MKIADAEENFDMMVMPSIAHIHVTNEFGERTCNNKKNKLQKKHKKVKKKESKKELKK